MYLFFVYISMFMYVCVFLCVINVHVCTVMADEPGLESLGDVGTFNMHLICVNYGGGTYRRGYDFDLRDYGVHFMWVTPPANSLKKH